MNCEPCPPRRAAARAARPLSPLLCVLLAVLAAPPLAARPEPVQLKTEMAPAEFSEAGLEKLTPDELAALEAWLNRRIDARVERRVAEREEAEKVERERRGRQSFGADTLPERARAAVADDVSPKFIESEIAGDFGGFEGGTTVRLANGQVWRQTDGRTYYVSGEDLKVRIRRGALGSYLLTVEGANRSVYVERVR